MSKSCLAPKDDEVKIVCVLCSKRPDLVRVEKDLIIHRFRVHVACHGATEVFPVTAFELRDGLIECFAGVRC